MSQKDSIILLSKVLSSPDGKVTNKACIDIIVEENIPVLCYKKAENKKRLMPFKALYENHNSFWQQSSGWEYYLTGEDFQILKEKAVVKPGAWEAWEKPASAPAA